jgi:hypothetical protein
MKSSKDHYIYEFKKRVDEVAIARSMFFKLYNQTQSDLVKLGCIRGILKAAEDMSGEEDISRLVSPYIKNIGKLVKNTIEPSV